MDISKTRSLGKSNLSVTPLGFGGGTIGSPFVPTVDAFSTVRAAWDSGVRFFDTAPWYGIGRSERRLGMALGDIEAPRDSYHINTKVGKSTVPEPTRDESKKTYCADGSVRTPRDQRTGFRIAFDYSAKGIESQHQDSLQRLGISSLNTLTIHDIDYGYHSSDQLGEVFQQLSKNGAGGATFLEKLRSDGVINAIGAGCNLEARNAFSWESSDHEDLIDRLVEEVDLDFLIIAGGYTLLETRALRRILPLCEQKQIGVIAATPFAGGWLFNPKHTASYMYGKAPPEILEKTLKIETICDKYNIPLAAAALQFQLSHPLVASVIPGSKTPEEAISADKLTRLEIPDQLWSDLKSRQLLDNRAPTP